VSLRCNRCKGFVVKVESDSRDDVELLCINCGRTVFMKVDKYEELLVRRGT